MQVLVGTGKSKLRLYDTKHGRRPVLDLTFGEARITSLAAEPNGEPGSLNICAMMLLVLPAW